MTALTGVVSPRRSIVRRARKRLARNPVLRRLRHGYYEARLLWMTKRPGSGTQRTAWGFYRLAAARRTAGHLEEAAEAYRAAIQCDDRPARYHYWLGVTLEGVGPRTSRLQPRLGLVSAPGDLTGATACYRAAIEREPNTARYWYRLGLALERLADHQSAKDAFEEAVRRDPDSAVAWYRYGRSILALAGRRGAFASEEYAEAIKAWQRTLELDPDHAGARQHIVRTSIRMESWPDASRWAWHPERTGDGVPPLEHLRAPLEADASAEHIAAAEEVLRGRGPELGLVPNEWWFALHWRLLAAKRFSAAYQAKSLMAEQVIQADLDASGEEVPRVIEVARALTFLGRHDDAVEHLARQGTTAEEGAARRAVEKVSADIDLLRGRTADHIRLLELHRDANPPKAEERFAELLRGRRVAIVGPAESTLTHGEEIDGFDVVIRTKYVGNGDDAHAPYCGSRTDISYYAASSTGLLGEEIAEALRSGSMQMAVFRTMTYSPSVECIVEPGDLRYTPSEYQAGLRAIQFAIQRIVHDVLRYEPSMVKIFNINFFLSPKAYRDGYNLGSTRLVEAQGLRKALSAFGHDFLADFIFTRQVHRAGLVDVDPYVGELLAMSPQDYLTVMDSTADRLSD